MNFQDSIAKFSREGAHTLMRTIRAMPADRIDWQVTDTARTVIEQLQECAQVPLWFAHIFESGETPFSKEFRDQQREERSKWTDLDDLERRLLANTEVLCAHIEALCEEDLEKTVDITPGWTVSYRELCIFHWRNLWYHAGQVNFIQTLYGDMDMH